MRILIINKLLAKVFGGTEKHIKEIIIHLSNQGHEITILTEKGNSKNLEEIKSLKNIRIVFLPSTEVTFKSYKNFKHTEFYEKIKGSPYLWKIFILLKKIISFKKNFKWILNSIGWVYHNKKKFDVISVHFYYEFEIAKFIKKFFKIPYVAVLESYSYLEADSIKKSKFVMTISKFIKDECEKIHNFSPKLIPIGIDSINFKKFKKSKVSQIKRDYSSNGEKIILNVARLVEGKGVRNMIEAAGIILNKRRDVNFIVCGDGLERKNFEELIKQLGIERNFHLVKVFGKDLIDYYNSADLFVHTPDLSNHFGIVYLEAMSAGLPIIATNYEATPSTVGNAALLVPIESPLELSKAISKLIDNPRLCKRLSYNGLKRVKEKFNWDKITPELERFYKMASNLSG